MGIAKNKESKLSYIKALDGLRGFALILVFLFHLFSFELQNANAFEQVFMSLMRIGWCGVDIFFVLSGFLITRILLTAKGEGSYYIKFYTRRILRIFPIYYSFLVIYLVILPFLFPVISSYKTGPDFVLWFYLINFKGHSMPTNHFWSLAVEEQFYLLWPFLVMFFTTKSLIRTCFLMLLTGLLFRTIISLGWTPLDPIKAYTLIFCRWDSLGAGALLAVLAHSNEGIFKKIINRSFVVGLFSLILLAFTAFLGKSTGYRNIYISTLGLSFVWIAAVSLIVSVFRVGPSRVFFENKTLGYIGRRSYAMYILHYPIMIYAEKFNFVSIISKFTGSLFAHFLIGFVLFALVLFLSEISWRLIESPFLKLKKYFHYEFDQKLDESNLDLRSVKV